MFSSRNKKNIDTFWLKKVPYQELCDDDDDDDDDDLVFNISFNITLVILS